MSSTRLRTLVLRFASLLLAACAALPFACAGEYSTSDDGDVDVRDAEAETAPDAAPGDDGGTEDLFEADGAADEAGEAHASCDGVPHGGTRACGPEAVGECRPGTQVCDDGVWGDCEGAVYPTTEICGNGLDEDCVEGPDNGCGCPVDGSGRVTVDLDGERIFDRDDLPRSLRCLGLEFRPGDFYGTGPAGAAIDVVSSDPAAGLLEVDLVGFADDHGNCEEKWGFVRIVGDCAEVMLEKWNAASCSPHYTDRLKLETWIDVNGDCEYQGTENDEPYGGSVPDWDPGHRYRLVFRWE
ncbi:MAG: hypothetical protein JXB32_05865 [Deltaproteobacteria bacterium]|nr:hypothetical protein [Deltaproteobacteria bacterium]